MIPDIVFLDRDGTLNRAAEEGEYVVRPDQVALLPTAAAAVRALNDAGVPVVVVTNQRGVALGRMSMADVARVNERVERLLAREGAVIDSWLVCPHAADECGCRKPAPGMLLTGLAARPDARPSRCVVIGDAESDVLAGRAAGVPAVLLAASAPTATAAIRVLPHLGAAVEWVLRGGLADAQGGSVDAQGRLTGVPDPS